MKVDKELNKERFINLIDSITRPGIKELRGYILNSDFFEAPASTAYHLNVEGGLCQHSLNVYDHLVKLVKDYNFDYSDDTIKIVALFHDLAKINFYKIEYRNKKQYNGYAPYSDGHGNYDWVVDKRYVTIPPSERSFVCGEHGFNSFFIVNQFMKLNEEESTAILNHHLGFDNGFAFKDMGEVLNRFPMLLLIHTADMMSTYIEENPYFIEK